jgi:RNA polymerase sigma-70 factor, ECF subfamily
MSVAEEFLRHDERLRSQASSLARDPERAADLVQETYATALAAASSYRDDGRGPLPWLFTIMRNLHVSGHRKRRRIVEDPDGEQAARLATPPSQFDHVALRQTIDRLRGLTQEDVVLCLALGHSNLETAALCGIHPVTVRSRARRGRAHARRIHQ